jgi:Family of unknown function (DUF6370)
VQREVYAKSLVARQPPYARVDPTFTLFGTTNGRLAATIISMRTIARTMPLLLPLSFLLGCQPQSESGTLGTQQGEAVHDRVLEVACGSCQFELDPAVGEPLCSLAVRIDGVAYFVDGSGIDDHGDAHAADGLCNAVRHASVSGKVVGGRFVATRVMLLPKAR